MNNDIIIKVYKRALIFSLFIIGFSLLIFKNPKAIILGYLFGLVISMLSFKLIDNTINKAVKMTPSRANSHTFIHYILRYIIYFMVLFVAAKANYLNFLSTVLGLLVVKFIIIVSTIVDKDFTK